VTEKANKIIKMIKIHKKKELAEQKKYYIVNSTRENQLKQDLKTEK
jgi:hypothetical protein